MKKSLFHSMAVLAVLASLASCGNRNAKNPNEKAEDATEEAATVEESASEATDLSAALENDYIVCPFEIQDNGKVDQDGNIVANRRYFIGGSTIGAHTMAEWVYVCSDPRFNFNVDGWHFVGKDIVNADETYKIDDEWVGDSPLSFSSFCTVPTVKYVKPAKVEPYTYIKWSEVVSMYEGEELPLKLKGNRHDYDKYQDYVEGDYDIYNVQASFYLNEYIEVYADECVKDMGLKAVCLPYRLSYDGVFLDDALMETALFSNDMNERDDDGKYFSAYISIDKPAGFYDLVFFQGERPYARIALILTKEPATEE